MRRAGRKPLVQACPDCGEPRIPHRVCMKCGTYGNRKVIDMPAPEAAE